MAGTTAVALAVAGCGRDEPAAPGAPPVGSPSASVAPVRTPGANGNPLAGRTLYVDPASDAAAQVAQWTAQGRVADARTLARIADRPIATWMTGGPTPVRARVDEVVGRAATSGRVPVLVAYNIPHRDCGNFSAGGAGSAAEYRAWIREFAAGIDHRPAVVVVEPDAVAHLVDGCADDAAQRAALLRDAIAVLKDTGSAVVYLDAGNPGWITDTDRLARALRRAGVAGADGFALNVSNFVGTAENIAFGHRVSDELGGATHFVIDTSRNGAGPVPGSEIAGGPRWCNPPGRALGVAPTTETGRARVDAYLWIKNPGDSDGACRAGEPAAGQWWPEYALELARPA
ncbi:glucanase [Actinoplanes ianthinogenes]|uniref:Glucanase n=1 Tax=Actinoplanes ianthinogenes TaxID=122358 RepID=A0ABM7M5R9_9ACTN|nr:glycoside hydrolase family 6 protein [Actinoplanes ianthinogenes]BCJ46991.1 glucanase [Actinoplanes ianthinogenes]GGR14112.1 glucanase [Actinoplanes ianthinogenes]